MNKQLKEAQEWEEEFLKIKSFFNKNIHKGFCKIGFLQLQKIAKANMEKLGCGKDIYDKEEIHIDICDNISLCEDCQKAKEIYEEILK